MLCLCNKACKRSLAICRKSRALCPVNSLLCVPIEPTGAENGEVDIIQTMSLKSKVLLVLQIGVNVRNIYPPDYEVVCCFIRCKSCTCMSQARFLSLGRQMARPSDIVNGLDFEIYTHMSTVLIYSICSHISHSINV